MDMSIDLSKSQDTEEILNFYAPSSKTKRRTSFFKPDELSGKKEVKADISRDRYLEAIEKEREDWMKLVLKTNERAKSLVLKEKVPLDSSILSKERREYLDQAVDLSSWVKETDEFCQRAFGYIKHKEWLSMRLKYIQDQLEDKLIDASCESF